MHARAVDDAATRLRELRHEEHEALGLALVALALSLAATQAHPALAMPLFLGGVAVGALGVRALWRRWDLVDRLAADRDAHVIDEVKAYAARETARERRHGLATAIRRTLEAPMPAAADRPEVIAELRALARELDDEGLELDPVAALECARLLRDPTGSPLFDPCGSPDELRYRVRHIRSGFEPRTS